jgi:hypothetical protein
VQFRLTERTDRRNHPAVSTTAVRIDAGPSLDLLLGSQEPAIVYLARRDGGRVRCSRSNALRILLAARRLDPL